MMRMTRLERLVLTLVCCMAGVDLMAQEHAKTKAAGSRPFERHGANYEIFQVETPLQHLLVYHLKARLFVAVNGSGVRPGGNFDQALLDALHRDLDQWESKGDVVQFNIFFGENSGRMEGVNMLFKTLGDLALDVGLQSDPAHGVWENSFRSWRAQVDSIESDVTARGNGSEVGLGDDRAMVYSVQTKLSRYLTGADAFVDFNQRLRGDATTDEAVLEVVRDKVAKLNLTRKRVLGIRMHGPPNELVNQHLKVFAKSLGFERSVVTVGG